MDPDDVRGVINQLLYPIDGAPELGETSAARLAGNIRAGRLFAASPAELTAALHRTLAEGRLHPQAVAMSRRYTEPELLDFLRRVAAHLDAAGCFERD